MKSYVENSHNRCELFGIEKHRSLVKEYYRQMSFLKG